MLAAKHERVINAGDVAEALAARYAHADEALLEVIADVFEELLGDRVEAARSKGYDEGCEDGRSEGYDEGFSEGYDQAAQEFWDKGYEKGYGEGLKEGYDRGVDRDPSYRW